MVSRLKQVLDLANPTLEKEDVLHLLGMLIAKYEAREVKAVSLSISRQSALSFPVFFL